MVALNPVAADIWTDSTWWQRFALQIDFSVQQWHTARPWMPAAHSTTRCGHAGSINTTAGGTSRRRGRVGAQRRHVFEVTRQEGESLVAEGWAVQIPLRPLRRLIQLQEQRRAEDRIRAQWHDEHA